MLSEENDALGKMGIERTEEARASFSERERARMERMAHRVSEELGLDEDAVQVVTDVNEIAEPKLRNAKGWFDPKTGKITVVIPNHTGTGDVLRTMLHEAVAHKGLRGLFGKRFDVFLDNVYAAADETVRRRISTLASKQGWDFRRATEEYLAGLAEDMHFEHVSPSFWQKIKLLFLQMLDRLGIRGYDSVTLTDNELRYVLWRSYQHMAHAGRYRSMEEVADKADAERAAEEDDAVRRSLRVGEYSDATADAAEAERAYAAERAADEAGMDVLLREGAEEDAASDTSGDQMQVGVAATRDALRARALQENAVHQQDFQRKLDAIGRQMGKLRQALAAQRAYDKSTVGILSGLARTMLKLGMLDKMSPSEESRLLTLMNAANGKADLTKEVDDLFDLMTKNLLRVSTASAFQTTSDEGMPVCGRCPAGMRLKETDEMLGIFEAETLADEGDGQRFVVQQLLGMGQKMVGDDVLGGTSGFHAHQVSEISARQAAFIREISYRGQPFALGFRGDVIIEQV